MEPARSDEIVRAPGANGDDRGGWRQNPQPASAYPARALWPWTFPTGSRHVPVVGPTEALRGPAGGPGMAAPSGAAPGLPDPARRSSWQLAQDVWQESGVTWERTAPELTDVEPAPLASRQRRRLAYPPEHRPPRATPTPSPPTEPATRACLPPEPAIPEPVGYEPSAARRRVTPPAYPEPPDLGRAYPEPADVDAEPTGLEPDPWLGGPEPMPASGPRLPPLRRPTPSLPTSNGPPPMRGRTAGRRRPRLTPPTRPDSRPGRRGVGGPGGADTRFSGVGPADSRFADGRSAARPPPMPSGTNPRGRDRRRTGDGSAGSGAGAGGGRAQRPGPAWNEYPPDGFPGQASPVGARQVPLGAPVVLDPETDESVSLTEPFGAGEPGTAGRPARQARRR